MSVTVSDGPFMMSVTVGDAPLMMCVTTNDRIYIVSVTSVGEGLGGVQISALKLQHFLSVRVSQKAMVYYRVIEKTKI